MNRPLLAFGLALLGGAGPCTSQRLFAQDSCAVLIGTVRAAIGAPLVGVSVRVGTRATQSDTVGRFVLTDLSGDSAYVRVRRLGFAQFDTVIVLHAGKPVRLDVALRELLHLAGTYDPVELRKTEAENAAAGRVDSGALGLLRQSFPNTAPPLTFGPFGARLLAAAVHERSPDANTVLSPVSAGLALSLGLLGTRGSTAAALSSALGTELLDRATLERSGASFISASNGRRDVQLDIANAIWVDSAALLTSGFAASVSAWRATVGTLRLASPFALASINRWADNATHGKIKSILSEPLPDTTKLFIANAVYFKGKWLAPFEKSATRQRDFTLLTGGRIQVPAMEMTEYLAYRRESGYQMVRLPYRGGRVAMYVILPDSGRSGTHERQFAERGWPRQLAAPDKQQIHLVLPKLHVEGAVDLKPLLLAQGAGVAFDCDLADFRDLAVDRLSGAPFRHLCIGKATQTVYLDVDEEGTEAAAVTGLGFDTITSVPPPPIEFIVDRPFLFLLRDESSGAALFVGSIRHP